DCAPGIAVQAGIEQARRVVERSAPGKSQLDLVPVRFTGADDPVVRPHRNAGRVRRLLPLLLLGSIRIGPLDERADAGKRRFAPVSGGAGSCIGRFGCYFQVRLLRPLTLGISVLTQTGSALQEGQSAIPGQSRRLRVVCLGAIRLDKPMSRASITMERDAAVRTLQ